MTSKRVAPLSLRRDSLRLVFVVALVLSLAVASVALARVEWFDGVPTAVVPYAPYTAGPVVTEEPYAPYTAGPVVREVRPFAPYTEQATPYAPYTAGPVVEEPYAPYTAGPVVREVRP